MQFIAPLCRSDLRIATWHDISLTLLYGFLFVCRSDLRIATWHDISLTLLYGFLFVCRSDLRIATRSGIGVPSYHSHTLSVGPTPIASPLFHHFNIFSNQLSNADCFIIPSPMRITNIMETQIRRRTARFAIPITRNMTNIAAIIKNGGELINSGITDSMT